LCKEIGRHAFNRQANQIAHLLKCNQNRDPIGESDNDRNRNEPDQDAHSQRAHCEQKATRHHGGNEQVGDTIPVDDAIEQGHKRAGRTANLDPRTTEQ